jgi:hypothetical protein
VSNYALPQLFFIELFVNTSGKAGAQIFHLILIATLWQVSCMPASVNTSGKAGAEILHPPGR